MSGPIGKPTPYIDGIEKVTGQAMYTDDFRFPNMLFVGLVRSPHAHACIKHIDISIAEKDPGVAAVAVGKDIPISFGILPISPDENAMAVEKVRYVGEIVAAVAAETVEAAQKGAEKIIVEYEPIREFIDPEDSLETCGKDEQIHKHTKEGKNIHKTAELRFNEPEKALEQSPFKCTESFKFAGVTHAFTEPHSTIAIWNGDETLTVISATQVPHYLHKNLAKVLELPLHSIQVKKPALGGGFGGKSDPFAHEMITAYLSKKTKRPVKCTFTREEVFITNHGRHPTTMDMSVGCDKDGIITALDTDIIIDGGAYGSFGVVTSYYNGVLLQGPYKIDKLGFRTRRTYTNKPQCGAMRGHGAVNPRYAVEVILDILAHDIGMDPCDLRMKNFLPENTLTVGQLRITSNGVEECLETVRKKSDWNNLYGKLPYGRGLGVACGFFISGSALPIIWNRYPQTVVHAKLDFDGRIVMFSGASEIGQGSDTMLVQIAAEELGIPMNHVQLEVADTKTTPVDLGSYSSRVTFMVGNAAKMAVEKIRDEMAKAIAKEKSVSSENILFRDKKIFTKDGALDIAWEEGVEIAMAGRGAFVESGYYISPKLGGDFKGAGAGLSPAYSFGAFISEVAVNPDTGEVNVEKIWAAHDCGKALNPLAVEGQIEGSIHMGLGQAVSEDMRYVKGQIMNANFFDYRIPYSVDTPEMDVTIIESNDGEGPYGAKEAGEGPIHPVLPSIGNAIYDAVGIRMMELPITPDKILNKVRENTKA
ncbi:MAG: molybdopterin-dependent oxidoreductase [Candidatus Marinimicrobia bacterium]|nr:molybdopterin-dependent oxidoreductase [Candidatus Neomarinimicrobiota bacterium]MDP7337606.1 molybdopterin-dependent oxidoreductase [Candidatus Neomarinimicrobiota bacterium]MDP7475998.1 molybdopterin-dependent oxidoreductase [Candidatus Neomarinimicrobiota bacterium]|tara:strand:- start:920 stop:3202 length:2283 start_codon:yes stop_codon:yes gene_type:complete